MSLLMAGGVEPDDLKDPFQTLPFYDSMILYFYILIPDENQTRVFHWKGNSFLKGPFSDI